MNIYGDMRICSVSNCDNKADVVESNRDYCAECWWKRFSNTGTSLSNYENKKKNETEQENERKRKQDIESFKEV